MTAFIELIANISRNVDLVSTATADLLARVIALEKQVADLTPSLEELDTKVSALAGTLTPKVD